MFLDFNFDRFATTTILKWAWKLWLVLAVLAFVAVTLAALGAVFANLGASSGVSDLPKGILLALVAVLADAIGLSLITLGVRVYLELICVVFRIAEDLRVVRNEQSARSSERSD